MPGVCPIVSPRPERSSSRFKMAVVSKLGGELPSDRIGTWCCGDAALRSSALLLHERLQAFRRMERQAPEVHPSDLPASVRNTLVGVQALQASRGLFRVNAIADHCFNVCVDDFSFSKKLGSREETCIGACVEKFLLLSRGTGSGLASALRDSL